MKDVIEGDVSAVSSCCFIDLNMRTGVISLMLNYLEFVRYLAIVCE